jgi:hypothetical protein
VVECFLAKEDVAGSTPVSRSKKPFCDTLFLDGRAGALKASFKSVFRFAKDEFAQVPRRGAVPKW